MRKCTMQFTLRAPCPAAPRHAVWAPPGIRASAGHTQQPRTQHHSLRCQALGGEPEEGSAAAAAGPSGRPSREELLSTLDPNQLHTALLAAVAAEKYELASKIRDLLALVSAGGGAGAGGPCGAARPADWEQLGVLPWLAERAEALGYRMPTEVQRRAAPVILGGSDCVVRSQTGSGKTLSFLLAALSALRYPPDLYPDDLKVGGRVENSGHLPALLAAFRALQSICESPLF